MFTQAEDRKPAILKALANFFSYLLSDIDLFFVPPDLEPLMGKIVDKMSNKRLILMGIGQEEIKIWLRVPGIA